MKGAFQGLFWIIVIAIAASLPWLVQDWLSRDKEQAASPAPPAVSETVTPPAIAEGAPEPDIPAEPLSPPSPPPAATPSRSLGQKVSDFIEEAWIRVGGSKDDNSGKGMSSKRSLEVASRIGPDLEAQLVEKKLTIGLPIFIRVFKESSELELWMEPEPGADWVLFKTYPICKWSGELGPKMKEGDGQSPEGFYFVSSERMNPDSRYHLSFDIGFPNDFDQQEERTGSFLMIHGECVSIGCYAMTNPAIEEIYTLATMALTNGQRFFRVHSFPFRMSDEKMDTLKEDAQWFEFWSNLKEGYDYFEFLYRPPEVTVVEGKYHFE